MVSNARCYIPSFKAIGLAVLEKTFKVFTMYRHGFVHRPGRNILALFPALLKGCI